MGDAAAWGARDAAVVWHGWHGLTRAIRPPTVPPGTSRLRIALSAAHDDAQLDRVSAALASLATMEPGGDRPA